MKTVQNISRFIKKPELFFSLLTILLNNHAFKFIKCSIFKVLTFLFFYKSISDKFSDFKYFYLNFMIIFLFDLFPKIVYK